MSELLIKNIGVLATPVGNTPLSGGKMGDVYQARDAAIHVADGKIIGVYTNGERPKRDIKEADAGGRLVTPGLVDAHTHLVFGGYRQHEIAKRLQGADYMQILREGGGILDTVRQTRADGERALFNKSANLLKEMSQRGVTACEIKSGYGLDIETELKQLRVARQLVDTVPMDIRTTFLGAHAVPHEWPDADSYADYIVREVLPVIASSGLADYCDAFCEDGAFTVEQSRMILSAAKAAGLGVKVHADELGPSGGCQLAAELGAVSADHLIASEDGALLQLAASGAVAVLLPQTSLYLDKPFARARAMISMGLPVALATDFNPGSCPSNNLHLSMNLGLIKYKLAPAEILSAVTLNAACAIGLGDRLGSIEPGKDADLVVWDAEDLSMICYRMGANLVKQVYKLGGLVN